MSAYPRRAVILKGATLPVGTTYYDSPQISYAPMGRLILGYQFASSGGGTLSIAIEHKSPDGQTWIAPTDSELVSDASAGSVIDSYLVTWGTSIRWKITVSTAELQDVYVWVELA